MILFPSLCSNVWKTERAGNLLHRIPGNDGDKVQWTLWAPQKRQIGWTRVFHMFRNLFFYSKNCC